MPYEVRGKCIYKKDGGTKVGCTKGSVKKYLAALHANANESTSEDSVIVEINKLKGGKADKLSIKDIADKFKTKVSDIEKQLSIGLKIEMEHTNDKSKAKEIAMDHLSEIPDYYTRLEKMEKEAIKASKKKLSEGKALIKLMLRENLISINKKKRYLTEATISNKNIINVDIQPEYANAFSFNVNEWVKFINKSAKSNRIIFLFNGEDTLGMINENDYRMWLNELGIKEQVIDSAIFYDKGYAFFRYCMDSGIDERNVADLVRFMMKHNINDSRQINEDMWNSFMEETNHSMSDVRELLEHVDDMISIPDLVEFLKNYSNVVLTGGGINECLKEVEIALLAMNKPFNILKEFTY